MSPAELALLLTLGRITRRLLQSQAIYQSGVQWIADLRELNDVMAHFEPSTAELEDLQSASNLTVAADHQGERAVAEGLFSDLSTYDPGPL